jgi:hypothetical protein
MQKIIREVDEKRGIVQVTVADERWYLKSSADTVSGIPVYKGVPSVTWIAGYYPKGIGFYKWLAEKGWDEAAAVKQAAGDKGSRVHYAVEKILNGEEFRIDTKVFDRGRSTELEKYETELSYEELVAVKSFCDWRADIEKDYTLDIIAIERTIFSDIHGYAGTIDLVARLTPKPEGANPLKLTGPTLFVIDFKTSKQIWREYELQVSAYRVALENGENPLFERNENGTETDELVDVSGMRTAILQLGYDRNKAGYKFTETPDQFDLFLTAKKIWAAETEGQDIKVRDFPIVLAPGKAMEPVEEAPAGLDLTPTSPKSRKAKSNGEG